MDIESQSFFKIVGEADLLRAHRCAIRPGARDRRESDGSGCLWQAVAGGSTGSGQNHVVASLEMALQIDLCAVLLDIATDGR
jgi:hypothetical protein